MALAACIACPLVARAATAIDGGNVGGQVWTAGGNPYVVRGVNGDLRVPIGQELRIEAGTEVLFSQSNGQVALSVALEGKLTISGTAAAPVVLQAEAGGTAVAWKGILPEATAVIRISDAVIRNAGVGILLRTPDARIDRTTFEYCTGGLRVHSGAHAFDSIITRNNTLGVEVLGISITPPYPSLSLTNALVQGNASGLIAKNGTTLTIINSTIDSNGTALTGYTRPGPTIDVQNTILSNNPTAVLIDDIGVDPPIVTVTHSTFWANTRNFVRMGSSTTTMMTSGDVALPGTGNAVADPKYVSATDLHLTAGSPCIDSGVAARAPDHDLDQNARPRGVTFDRGAYEFGTGGGAAGTGGGSGATGTGGGGAGTGGASGATGAAGSAGAAGRGSAGVGGGGPGAGGDSAGAGGAGIGGASEGGASGPPGGASGGGGGRGGMGGAGGRAGGPAGGTTDDDDEDGCRCGVGGTNGGAAGLAFVALGFLLSRRRRRATRPPQGPTPNRVLRAPDYFGLPGSIPIDR